MSSNNDSAMLQYGPNGFLVLPNGFLVLKSGQHVFCAISGEAIQLEELRYWSVEHQEPYATCELATQRLTEQT